MGGKNSDMLEGIQTKIYIEIGKNMNLVLFPVNSNIAQISYSFFRISANLSFYFETTAAVLSSRNQ